MHSSQFGFACLSGIVCLTGCNLSLLRNYFLNSSKIRDVRFQFLYFARQDLIRESSESPDVLAKRCAEPCVTVKPLNQLSKRRVQNRLRRNSTLLFKDKPTIFLPFNYAVSGFSRTHVKALPNCAIDRGSLAYPHGSASVSPRRGGHD